jgi:hypothetical protein
MATAEQTIRQALEGKGCLGRAKPTEPVFVLRAQDIHAADLVEKWAIWAGTGGCDADKVAEARTCVEDMRNWHPRKHPD